MEILMLEMSQKGIYQSEAEHHDCLRTDNKAFGLLLIMM